eukprot:364699-Chlamydomonas_euryale.AAC.19
MHAAGNRTASHSEQHAQPWSSLIPEDRDGVAIVAGASATAAEVRVGSRGSRAAGDGPRAVPRRHPNLHRIVTHTYGVCGSDTHPHSRKGLTRGGALKAASNALSLTSGCRVRSHQLLSSVPVPCTLLSFPLPNFESSHHA